MTTVYQVREAAEMRCQSHIALPSVFYSQSCLRLYRQEASREHKRDLDLCFPTCSGRWPLKCCLFSGLETTQTGRITFDLVFFIENSPWQEPLKEGAGSIDLWQLTTLTWILWPVLLYVHLPLYSDLYCFTVVTVDRYKSRSRLPFYVKTGDRRICVYRCIYVFVRRLCMCIHVCHRVCIRASMYVRMHVCVYVWMYVCKHVGRYECM